MAPFPCSTLIHPCVFKACLNMYEVKANFKKMYESDFSYPLYEIEDETFEHIFSCSLDVLCELSQIKSPVEIISF